MNFIKRIGTQRHKFKLQFVMRKIKFNKKLSGQILIKIHRGEHKYETKQCVQMANSNECDLKKQIVTFPAITLFFQESTQLYQPKQGQMKVIMTKSNGDKKLIGLVPFDVAEFVNMKTQSDKLKFKKKVEEIPQKLKMEAEIEFSVFFKFIGEGSQTDKSNDNKLRNQSSLDKLKNFFFGNQPQKPPQAMKQPNTTKQIKSKKQNKKQDSQDQQPPSNREKPQRSSLDKYPPKKKNSQKPKVKQQNQRQSPKGKLEQPNQRHHKNIKTQEGQLIPIKKQLTSKLKEQKQEQKPNKEVKGKDKSREKKNIVQQKQRDNFSEYQDKRHNQSNYNKSQQPHNNQSSDVKIYFDDPTTFVHLANKPNIPPPSPPKQQEPINNAPEKQDNKKAQIITASPKRKVKENSIQINKQLHKEDKRKSQEQNHKKPQNITPKIPPEQSKPTKLQTQQINNIFTSFEQPIKGKKEQPSKGFTLKKVQKSEQSIFLKEQLQRKQKEMSYLSSKLQKLQGVQKKLKEEQSAKAGLQKTLNQLKQQNKRLQKQVQRIKQQNQCLRTQKGSQQSFFRATVNHYQQQQQPDLIEQNKRLQKEKNEMLININKQREKHKKEIKDYKEQLEKQRNNYKQLENLSKIELKKLKDQNLKINSNLESAKDKYKEKTKENDTFLTENKKLNESVIELKEKLASLKIKIGEKLNQANERGEAELMEALTDLSESM